MTADIPFVLVSNRGPATFEGGEARRGGGGLVTALTGLVHHRDAVWVASAMTEEDVEVSRRHAGDSFEVELDDARYRVKLVESDAEAYDRFYNVVANPMLWFIGTRSRPTSRATARSTRTLPARCSRRWPSTTRPS